MLKRSLLMWAAALVLIAVPTARTWANISEAAVLFLRIAPGSRPAGMGEAFVAMADDATASHWNPAGLGRYPLSDLWLDVPIPRDRAIADFAVVENDVPHRNYTRYDIWILTEARAGYFETARMKNPRDEALDVPAGGYTLTLRVDGRDSGPIPLPEGSYTSSAELVRALQSAIDDVLLASDVKVSWVADGGHGVLRITSGTTGILSSVALGGDRSALPEVFTGGRSAPGRNTDLMRATPPSHYSSIARGESDVQADQAAAVDYGIWETGDEYEPDASENLINLVKTRTGLPDGPELDARVAQVAALNQYVTSDSLRSAWRSLRALNESVVTETLIVLMETLFEANEVLNSDRDGLDDLLDEIDDIQRSGDFDQDDVAVLEVLTRRAAVPYLPEKLTFPFAMNLPGDVTGMTSRERTLYVGTTRGALMYVDGRSVALNDSTAGQAAGVVRDVQVSRTGELWVATATGPSRYSGTWKHFDNDHGWSHGACDRIFLLGENDIFAATGGSLVRYDEQADIWLDFYEYEAAIGDDLRRLPGKLLGITDSVTAVAYADSLVRYSGLPLDDLEPGARVRIPYHLVFRGRVLSLTRTNDGTLWIGTSRGLASVTRERRAHRYGYEQITVSEETTILDLARSYTGGDDRQTSRLANRIREDNRLDGDVIPAGTTLEVATGMSSAAIHSLRAEGKKVLIGTEFGMIEHDGGDDWSRYSHNDLEWRQVSGMAERNGERWFATQDRVVVYARPRRELTFMHVKWLPTLADDLYYEFFGGSFPIAGWGTIGANITFLSLGTQIGTDATGNVTGEFGTFEVAGTLSYGTRLSNALAVGLSAKIIYSHLSDQGAGQERGSGTATGVALDGGLIWQTPWKRLDLGLAITNVGPNISYIDANQADPLPRNLAVGLAYRLIHSPYNKLTLVAEMNKDLVGRIGELDEAIFNGGIEYQYGSFIALRAGYIYDSQGDIKKPTMGAGLQYRHFLFDFAYIPSSSANKPLDNTTRLSLSVRW